MANDKRDIVFQRWSGVIMRESRDIAALEAVRARAESDADVRDDPTLQGMIRVKIEERRNRIEQQLRSRAPSQGPSQPRPTNRTEPPIQAPVMTPAMVRQAFDRMANTIFASLERGNDSEVVSFLEKLRALQAEHPGIIPDSTIAECGRRVNELRAHVGRLRERVGALREEAVLAARSGTERDVARAMRRLLAVHAAHPALLTELQLDEIRAGMIRAADERCQHDQTTRRVLERERAIAAEIKALAESVRTLHHATCTLSGSPESVREAEAAYLRTMERVRGYDTEWFLALVLEMADLMAEWTVAPSDAEGQIDRFLEGVRAGVDRIQSEVSQIEENQRTRERRSQATESG